MHDWKSTASGILTGMIGTCTSVTAFLAPYMMTAPASTQALCGKIILSLNLVAIICKVWLGTITKNADATATALAINNVADVGPGAAPSTTATLTATPKETV